MMVIALVGVALVAMSIGAAIGLGLHRLWRKR
jgi:hypothetical protein